MWWSRPYLLRLQVQQVTMRWVSILELNSWLYSPELCNDVCFFYSSFAAHRATGGEPPQSAQDKARMDKEYLSLMAELGEAPVPTSAGGHTSTQGAPRAGGPNSTQPPPVSWDTCGSLCSSCRAVSEILCVFSRTGLRGWVLVQPRTGTFTACLGGPGGPVVLEDLTVFLLRCPAWEDRLCLPTPMACLHPGCSPLLLPWARDLDRMDTQWVRADPEYTAVCLVMTYEACFRSKLLCVH